MVVALIALFVSLGGVSYGVATGFIDGREIKNNAVATKDLKNNDIRGRDVRNNSLTGADVNEARLGKVPSADNATQLDGAAAAAYAKTEYEAVHLVGGASEPAFATGYSNYGFSFAPAGFYKDPFGIVHLQGLVKTGAGAIAFTLPEGYRPSTKHYQIVAEQGATDARITVAENGTVNVFDKVAGNFVSLEYISFRVGT